MSRAAAIVAAATIITAAYLLYTRAGQTDIGTTEQDATQGELPDQSTVIDTIMSTVNNITASVPDALANANVQAFLRLIRTGEGTLGDNGYRTMFGGGLFTGYADHPRQKITRNGITSTAAGAYQFLSKTWDEMAAKYDLPDFSPNSQDIACIGLLKRRGALGDIEAGRFATAISKCNKEWASLPGSPYGQPTLTWARAQTVLASAGATSAEVLA